MTGRNLPTYCRRHEHQGSQADHRARLRPGHRLFTDDLDGDCESLRAAGVKVDGPNTRPWGRDATFSDPDGNGFVLMSAHADQ
ncbi:VOC family protein [Micromonospora chersina]|uniref:VOC family protein n=1 Tax=Micromonospora chersina TaxID=47854 RepID=UPI003717847A